MSTLRPERDTAPPPSERDTAPTPFESLLSQLPLEEQTKFLSDLQARVASSTLSRMVQKARGQVQSILDRYDPEVVQAVKQSFIRS